MIVVNSEKKTGQIRTKIKVQNLTTLQLFSKNKKEYKKSYKAKIFLHVEDKFLSKLHIIRTQKQTKITLTTQKLHSLHPFI